MASKNHKDKTKVARKGFGYTDKHGNAVHQPATMTTVEKKIGGVDVHIDDNKRSGMSAGLGAMAGEKTTQSSKKTFSPSFEQERFVDNRALYSVEEDMEDARWDILDAEERIAKYSRPLAGLFARGRNPDEEIKRAKEDISEAEARIKRLERERQGLYANAEKTYEDSFDRYSRMDEEQKKYGRRLDAANTVEVTKMAIRSIRAKQAPFNGNYIDQYLREEQNSSMRVFDATSEMVRSFKTAYPERSGALDREANDVSKSLEKYEKAVEQLRQRTGPGASGPAVEAFGVARKNFHDSVDALISKVNSEQEDDIRTEDPQQKRQKVAVNEAGPKEYRSEMICNGEGFPSHMTTQEILAYKGRYHANEAARLARIDESGNYGYVSNFLEEKKQRGE